MDTSALEDAIARAEALDGSDYTKESWSALEQALAEAKAVLADPNATQETVDAAAEALNAAIGALVAESGSAVSEGESAKTGDSSMAVLAIGLALCAAAVAGGIYAVDKRRGTR